ncbi:hypothetical protein [Enterococcus sp. CWB-B31]|uniref:hypothetical protein n=1 Tax=Enterococcus sp. CWB-B31 TaxID=2885159 RepID=UPI001E3DF74C|nr:hypothetical protein [Enterococcus sp. CWB-B31]MCB5955158.1 hypothetical protein [Enterococcus sp. CWB-B31]
MNGGNLAIAGGGILDDAVTVIANGANSQAGAITSTGAQTGTQIVMAVRGEDGIGKPHTDKTTGEKLMAHVHDKTVQGGGRVPRPDEIPKTS